MEIQGIVDAVFGLGDERAVLQVGEAVNERVSQLRSARLRDLSRRMRIGSRVQLNEQARPQHPLRGLTGAVAEIPREAMVIVKLDEPSLALGNTFREGCVMVALEAIDLLPDAAEDTTPSEAREP